MSDLAARATRWYRGCARDLPWRRPGTSPWAVLVSEVMLQQTPVARVLPAWREWVDRWPLPQALAVEAPAAAIRAWGRLGYPRRALRLHACAVELVTRHGGAVPSELEELLALPGIGAYTARAVAAFAYGQRQPVVDTNVRRLVARAVRGVPDAGPATTARDLSEMERLLPLAPAEAAAASVALMELGALICTARRPRCGDCPLATICAWRRAATGGEIAPRRRSQRYAGTDRQARGRILAVLREATGSVSAARLDAVWPDAEQRHRALTGLIADGLACDAGRGRYALPGLGGVRSGGSPRSLVCAGAQSHRPQASRPSYPSLPSYPSQLPTRHPGRRPPSTAGHARRPDRARGDRVRRPVRPSRQPVGGRWRSRSAG